MTASCLNCGEPAPQRFCPACGQATADQRRSLTSLFGEFFTEFLSLDSRHFRTVTQLFVPGRLPELWLAGKRASYVAPVRVYFVASLLFFLLVGFPAPDAERYNVWVDDVLIGRDAPDPELGNLQLSGRDAGGWLSRRVEPFIAPHVGQLRSMPAQDLLDGLCGGLERTVPTTLIFFVPILAAAIKLLYLRRHFFYVDHLVFALHFQSFLFLLLVTARLAIFVGLAGHVPALVTYILAVLLIAPAYLLLALRRVYGQGWIHTVIKTGLLGVLYLLLIQPVLVVTFVLVIRAM